MLRKRRLLIIAIIAFITFIISTNYLLKILNSTESEVKFTTTQHLIYNELSKLPNLYKNKAIDSELIVGYIRNFESNSANNFESLWKEANSWVSKSGVVNFSSSNLGQIYSALKTAKIVKADLDTRGTQLKLLLTLEGRQEVVFKPKWYEIDKVIEGPVYAGKDRFFSEIIAFYLSVILDQPFTPISVPRNVSLRQEVLPVATRRLLNTSFERHNNTCIYGKCFYCRKEDPVCEHSGFLSGAVIFNIKAPLRSYRSPWQRTYKRGKKAVWEENEDYCTFVKSKLAKQRLYDLIDTAIFDFLIQNGDRHHYETLYNKVILLDNGKGFGNPNFHHIDILAPLYQCCILRRSTLKKLLVLSGAKFGDYLDKMPDAHFLITKSHLKALHERLLIIFATVEYCKTRNVNKSLF